MCFQLPFGWPHVVPSSAYFVDVGDVQPKVKMGAKASKAIPKKPIVAARSTPPPAASSTSNPLDGLDPHLRANLQVLGQVKINKQSTTYRSVRPSYHLAVCKG